MKAKKHFLFGYLMLSLVVLACSQEEDLPVSPFSMADCPDQTSWDSVQTKNALIGPWEWQFIDCFWWYPEEANGEEYQGLVIMFKADDTLEVIEEGQVTQTAHWTVVHQDGDFFGLEVDPPVAQLYGRIRFCNDVVVFNDSYIDGCDNFFRRKDGTTAYGVQLQEDSY